MSRPCSAVSHCLFPLLPMENRPHIEEMPTGKDDPFRAWPGDCTRCRLHCSTLTGACRKKCVSWTSRPRSRASMRTPSLSSVESWRYSRLDYSPHMEKCPVNAADGPSFVFLSVV
jgi:hypothetical protein